MISHALVSCEEIKLCLDSVILLIQEVDLVLKLCDCLFICLLLVFHVEFLDVLASSVKIAQSDDLIVSSLDCCIEFFDFVFDSKMILD